MKMTLNGFGMDKLHLDSLRLEWHGPDDWALLWFLLWAA